MKKQFAIAALSFAALGSASAQSLFDFAPDDSETESFPLKWSAGVNFGYDDNPTPLVGGDSSLFGQLYVGASLLNNTPQTTTEFFAKAGVTHYFDDISDVPGRPNNAEETTPNFGLGLNWTHRVSERLRLVSRNFITYELEPDYTTGIFGAKQVGSYLRWSSNNAVGYRWTERLATYTGVSVNSLDYDDGSGQSDRFNLTFYNDFRYQVSPQTVATFTVRYTEADADGGVADSTRLYFLAGVEHRVSSNTVFSVKAGVQQYDIDGGRDGSSPHVEAALRSQVNEAFSVSTYARYSHDDYNRTVNGNTYDGSDTLRLGVRGAYRVSEPLTLTGGVNYYSSDYEDGGPNITEDLINFHVGFAFRISDGISLNGNYNYSDFTSDVATREYDRSRFNLGVSAEF